MLNIREAWASVTAARVSMTVVSLITPKVYYSGEQVEIGRVDRARSKRGHWQEQRRRDAEPQPGPAGRDPRRRRRRREREGGRRWGGGRRAGQRLRPRDGLGAGRRRRHGHR